MYPTCKTYYGLCSCGEDYVVETKRNVSVRYDEHDKPSKKLKPAVHLEKNIDHYFTWRPSLKEQIDCDALVLFRNDVTWSCVNYLWLFVCKCNEKKYFQILAATFQLLGGLDHIMSSHAFLLFWAKIVGLSCMYC